MTTAVYANVTYKYERTRKQKMTWGEAMKSFIYNRKNEKAGFIKFLAKLTAFIRGVSIPVSVFTLADGLILNFTNEWFWIGFSIYGVIRIIVLKIRGIPPVMVYL